MAFISMKNPSGYHFFVTSFQLKSQTDFDMCRLSCSKRLSEPQGHAAR